MMKHQLILKTAPDVWRCLKGIFCIYKPPRVSLKKATTTVSRNLSDELNKMKYFDTKQENVHADDGISAIKVHSSKTCPDYSRHPLVLGDIYHKEDFSLFCMTRMPWFVSGVCVMGIGEENLDSIRSLQKSQFLSTFSLEGKLGVATRNFYYTGAPVERTSVDHVTATRFERALYTVQSHHQKKLVNQLGLPLNSQEAYEVLSQGLVRPHESLGAVIHGIKLTEFSRPHFSVEVTGVNLDGDFLLGLINDFGLMVRSSAHTLQIRCIRRGPFTLDLSLLRQQWFAQPIITNINDCRPLVAKLQHEHANLVDLPVYEKEQKEAYEEHLRDKRKFLTKKLNIKLLECKSHSTSNSNLEGHERTIESKES